MDVKKSIFRGSWGNTHNSHVQQTLLSNLITKNKSVILPIKIVFGNNQQKNNKLLFSKENGEFKPYISINDASLRGKNSSLEINALTGETSLIENNSTTVPSRIINAVLSTSPQTGETLELKIANTLVLSIQLAALRAKASQIQQAQVPGEPPVEALRDKGAIQKLSLVPPITEETNPSTPDPEGFPNKIIIGSNPLANSTGLTAEKTRASSGDLISYQSVSPSKEDATGNTKNLSEKTQLINTINIGANARKRMGVRSEHASFYPGTYGEHVLILAHPSYEQNGRNFELVTEDQNEPVALDISSKEKITFRLGKSTQSPLLKFDGKGNLTISMGKESLSFKIDKENQKLVPQEKSSVINQILNNNYTKIAGILLLALAGFADQSGVISLRDLISNTPIEKTEASDDLKLEQENYWRKELGLNNLINAKTGKPIDIRVDEDRGAGIDITATINNAVIRWENDRYGKRHIIIEREENEDIKKEYNAAYRKQAQDLLQENGAEIDPAYKLLDEIPKGSLAEARKEFSKISDKQVEAMKKYLLRTLNLVNVNTDKLRIGISKKAEGGNTWYILIGPNEKNEHCLALHETNKHSIDKLSMLDTSGNLDSYKEHHPKEISAQLNNTNNKHSSIQWENRDNLKKIVENLSKSPFGNEDW